MLNDQPVILSEAKNLANVLVQKELDASLALLRNRLCKSLCINSRVFCGSDAWERDRAGCFFAQTTLRTRFPGSA